MRQPILLALLLTAACTGTEPATAPTPAPPPADAPAEPPLVPEPAAAAAPLPTDAPELADRFLVIVASETDPAAALAKVTQVQALGELGVHARTLLSSRFKNLMPCYTIAIADALPARADAAALAKRLKAAGVSAYVKNAGAFVGPSVALDAFCAGAAAAPASTSVSLVTRTSDLVAIGLSGRPPADLGPYTRLGDGYDAWSQAARAGVGDDAPAAWKVVAVTTGATTTCTRTGVRVLTLGTPHFGVLQDEEKPTEPTCGEPELYATVDCALPDGVHVAVPPDAPAPVAYTRGPDADALVEAATRVLTSVPGWKNHTPSEPESEPTRSVTVRTFTGPTGALHVVEGRIEDGNGVCGGDDATWRAVYVADGTGLGRRISPFVEAHFTELVGLVDVDADGSPEVVTTAFPNDTIVSRLDGTELTRSSIAYCDCAC